MFSGLAEPVAFTFERDVRVRDATPFQRFDDHLRLRRRNDLVVEPLQEQQRIRDRIGMRDG